MPAALVLFVGSAAAGLTPVADGDVFWHLAAGREMLRTRSVLLTDPFSVSAAGQPWIDVHWLFQLAVYGIHGVGGLAALVYVKCLVLGAGALLLYAALDRTSRRLFVPIFLGSLLCARHLLLVRPVIVSLLFLGVFLLQLERFRRLGRVGLLAPLPFVQIVWSNCQGLFALGPALIAAYAIGAGVWAGFGTRPWFPFAPEESSSRPARHRFSSLLLMLALCLAGSLITPYGARALILPIKLFARLVPGAANPYEQVAENIPPFLLERLAAGQFWHLKWFLGLLVVAFAVSAGRLVLSHLLLVAGFVGLALMSNRNVLLLYWVAAPIAALQLAPPAYRLLFGLRRYRGPIVARWLGRATLASLLLVAATAAARESSFREPVPFRFPIESARIIEKTPGRGTIFSADHQGGYLIWRLYPRFRPYIDTRLVLRTPEQFSEYLDLAANPQRFEAFHKRQGFSYVVLPVAYPDRYLNLITHLYRSPQWKLIFTDGSEVLFACRDCGREQAWNLGSTVTTERMLENMFQHFGASPPLLTAARIQAATLEIALGQFDEAERILSRTDSPAAQALRARSRLAAGDLEGAQELGEMLLRNVDDDARNLDLMALVYVRRGQLPQAVKFLRRALAIDPFDSEAMSLLARLEEHRHEP